MTTYKLGVSDLFTEPLVGYPAQEFRAGEPTGFTKHVLWIEWRGVTHYIFSHDRGAIETAQQEIEYTAGMPCWTETLVITDEPEV
jgi:hypothetical protein